MEKIISKIVLRDLKEHTYFLYNYNKYLLFKISVLLFASFPMSIAFKSILLKISQGELIMIFAIISLILFNIYVLVKFVPSFLSKNGIREDIYSSLREIAYQIGSDAYQIVFNRKEDLVLVKIINGSAEFNHSFSITPDSKKLTEDFVQIVNEASRFFGDINL